MKIVQQLLAKQICNFSFHHENRGNRRQASLSSIMSQLSPLIFFTLCSYLVYSYNDKS